VLPRVAACYRVLQRVASCCRVSQRVTACCSVLPYVAACYRVVQCYRVLQRVVACCIVLPCVAVCYRVLRVVACYRVLQRVIACCSVLPCVAARYRVLQRVTACCSVLLSPPASFISSWCLQHFVSRKMLWCTKVASAWPDGGKSRKSRVTILGVHTKNWSQDLPDTKQVLSTRSWCLFRRESVQRWLALVTLWLRILWFSPVIPCKWRSSALKWATTAYLPFVFHSLHRITSYDWTPNCWSEQWPVEVTQGAFCVTSCNGNACLSVCLLGSHKAWNVKQLLRYPVKYIK
jgi:hypothetical protein